MPARYPLLACLVLTLLGSPSGAVILNSRDPDPPAHRTAPAGLLANSGWQWQGTWGGFLGTAVAPNFFLTAKHCGGQVGGKFTLGGVEYTTIQKFDSPKCDLTLWKVSGTLPTYAPLFTGSDEQGKALVVIGRGTERGEPVVIPHSIPAGRDLRGWRWGPGRGVQRWGTNTVSAIVEGGPKIGPLLAAAFDADAGDTEAHLSSGDSGGAVFIRDGDAWRLAGISFSVDDFKQTDGENPFRAALFDYGGLYSQTEASPEWKLIPDVPADVPSRFYATRISAHVEWIRSVVEN